MWHHKSLRNCTYCLGSTMYTVDGRGLLSPQPAGDQVTQCENHPRVEWIKAEPKKKTPRAEQPAEKPAAKKAAPKKKKTPAKKASAKKAK